MKKSLRIAVAAMMVFIVSTGAFSQEWTKAQKEVWQVCENLWKAYQAGNVDAIAASIHPNYQGWDDESFLPYSKEKTIEWFKNFSATAKVINYDIEAARITVVKDAAVVDYYYSIVRIKQGEKQEAKEEKGRAVEFYVKEGNNWMLLGDMGVDQ